MGKELSVAKQNMFAAIEETKEAKLKLEKAQEQIVELESGLKRVTGDRDMWVVSYDKLKVSYDLCLIDLSRQGTIVTELTDKILSKQLIPKEEVDAISNKLLLCEEELKHFKGVVASAGKFFLRDGTEVRFSKTGDIKEIGWTSSIRVKEITNEEAYNLHRHVADLLNKTNDRIKKNADTISFINRLVSEGKLIRLQTINEYIATRFSKKNIFMFWKKKSKLQDAVKADISKLNKYLFE